jgi:O-antigen ligase
VPAKPRARACRTIARYGLLALLALSPLPFGSVEPWAVLVIEWAGVLLGGLALYVLFVEPATLPRRALLLLLPPGLLLAIGVLQILPGSLTRWIPSPAPAAEHRAAVASVLPEVAAADAPYSFSPPDTIDAVLRILAYALIGLAAAVVAREGRDFRRLSTTILLSGGVQAAYGAAEYLSGHQHIFGYAKRYYLLEATGTFINRNHFAGYLAMTLPFAVGALLSGLRDRAGATRWRERFLRAVAPERVRTYLAGGSVALIWAGVLLSYSRGGLLASAASTAVVCSTTRARRWVAFLAVLLLSVPLLLLLRLDIRVPGERLLELRGEAESVAGRLAVWRASLEIVPDYVVFGSGLGTFEPTFQNVQPPGVVSRYDHAHNDWLEALLEGGVGALAAALAFVALSLWPVRRPRTDGVFATGVALAPVAGITAISLHSLFDFCLRIPAIGVLLAVLVGLASARWKRRTDEDGLRGVARLPAPIEDGRRNPRDDEA